MISKLNETISKYENIKNSNKNHFRWLETVVLILNNFLVTSVGFFRLVVLKRRIKIAQSNFFRNRVTKRGCCVYFYSYLQVKWICGMLFEQIFLPVPYMPSFPIFSSLFFLLMILLLVDREKGRCMYILRYKIQIHFFVLTYDKNK
jgi:hypothetical protein